MSDVLTDLVVRYGYLAVALFLFLEGLGLPVPGESALVTAAAFAGRGTLSVVGVVLAAIAGTITGTAAGYWIGLRGGPSIIAKYGQSLRLSEARMARLHAFFEKHGAQTLLFGRFVAFLRSFIGIFAGVSGMPARRFMMYNAAGGVVWVGTFATVGFLFGRNLPRLIGFLGRVSLLFAILVALGVGLVFGWRWFKKNRVEVVEELDRRWERLAETPPAGMPVPSRRTLLRLARDRYLALHLFFGFAISLVAIGIFGSISEDIVETSPLTRFDAAVANRLHGLLAPPTLKALDIVSALGARSFMTVLFLGGAALLIVRRLGLALTTWCAAFVGGALLDVALKFVVRRSALPFADEVVKTWSTGVVSGHVLGVVVGYGMLTHLLVGLSRRASSRTLIVVGITGLVAGIAVARLYLGVHYVSDEAAGLAAGVLWLMACISGLEIARGVAPSPEH